MKTENSSVLRCLPKVQVERPVLRRSFGKSFHKREPATQNDRWPNVLLQRGTVKR